MKMNWRQLKFSLLIGLTRIAFSAVIGLKRLSLFCSQASFCRIRK
jgi:hypothetical protein